MFFASFLSLVFGNSVASSIRVSTGFNNLLAFISMTEYKVSVHKDTLQDVDVDIII